MNTADRSIAVIDYALRRRFVFLDLPASLAPIAGHTGYPTDTAKQAAMRLFEMTDAALANTSPGLRVGPSYYLVGGADEADGDAEDGGRLQRWLLLEDLEQVEQRGGGVADGDDGSGEVGAPQFDGCGGLGGAEPGSEVIEGAPVCGSFGLASLFGSASGSAPGVMCDGLSTT